MSRPSNPAYTSFGKTGPTRKLLKKCRYDNLMRLAKFLKLDVGPHPSPGLLADLVSRAMQK
jgi:hypothetical protein